jgi:hypothetical protein
MTSTNPNAARPTLTLIGKKPIALAAFKAKLKLVEPEPTPGPDVTSIKIRSADLTVQIANSDVIGIEVNPDVGVGHVDLRQHDVAETPKPHDVAETPKPPDDVGVIVPGARHKKFKPHPYASALLWPPRTEWLPAIDIPGEPVPPEQLKPDKNPVMAAKFWVRRVAFEVAKDLPEGEREACERFVLRHRLSVLAAFHRRLKRSDLVAAMIELFSNQFGSMTQS